MPKTNFEELLNAGVHFGHLKRKWNPNMAPYIFMEKNGIHIIDLHKTIVKLDEAAIAIKQIAKSGRKILFVATKKQAKDIVAERIKNVNMPYVTERWPGGMLTNFPTIRKAVKKMSTIDKMSTDGTYDVLSKREKLQVARQRAKLEKNLGSIADLTRLPAAMFVVDIVKENIAVREATRLNIPVFAIVDTNSNPNLVDFPIPANDDASKSIDLIVSYLAEAIEEGLSERKMEKDKETTAKDKKVKDAKDAKEAAALKKLKLKDIDEDEEDIDEDEDEDEGDEMEKAKPLSLQDISDDDDDVKVVEDVKKPRIVKKAVRKKED
ncbi:MAG: 30S ribosomal protein S2 [Bacteroidales bacterium]|nr:30S ribosomal protein S2 [Bacteroidales bacterium]MCB8999822.1 30S ribosomal protein S2 [Bacteroidales bacterium]